MMKKLFTLLLGNTIASFAITCVIKSGLGCFAITACNMALANWFGLSLGVAGMIVELIMLSYVTYKGEGIGIASIVNATYGSLMIDVFNSFLPSGSFMIIGLLLLPIGWSLVGRSGLGDAGSNMLMNIIIRQTGKSITLIRGVEECTFMVIGLLGARSSVTWFTILLSVGLGYLLNVVYKVIGYEPEKVEHSFIIKRKIAEKVD